MAGRSQYQTERRCDAFRSLPFLYAGNAALWCLRASALASLGGCSSCVHHFARPGPGSSLIGECGTPLDPEQCAPARQSMIDWRHKV
jgi:hypothetical protein